jgi:tetratricopeptide (TPR) repeat protein
MIFYLALWLALAQGTATIDSLTQQAHSLFESGNYSEAQKKIQQAIHLEPRNAALWSDLGIVDAQMNQVKPAIAAFEKALSLDPENSKTCFNLALLYAGIGAPDKALDLYRKGLSRDPHDTAANKNYALLLIKARNFREALVPLRRLKSSESNDATVRIALIECYFGSGMNQEGKKEIREFLNSSSVSQSDQLQLASVLIRDKHTDPAQEVLEHVVVTYPDSAEAHGDLGLLLASRNKFEEGVHELGRAAQLAPYSPDYNMWLAEALLEWEHYSTAVDFLLAVKERFGTQPEYHYKLARAYYALKRCPMVIDELEPLSKAQPESEFVCRLLGACYLEVGDSEKAEAQFRQAVQLNPNKASYYSALGRVLRKEGPQKTDEAMGYFKKALLLNPSDTESKLRLALCYEEKSDLPTDQRLLEEVVRIDPGSLEAHRALARVHYRLGNKSEGDKESGIVAQLEAKENQRDAEDKQRRLQLQRQSPPLQ